MKNQTQKNAIKFLLFLDLICRNEEVRDYLNSHSLNIKFDDEKIAPAATSNIIFVLTNCLKNNLLDVKNQQIHALCLAIMHAQSSSIENISRTASKQILSHLLELFGHLTENKLSEEDKNVYFTLIKQYLTIIMRILARFQLNPLLVTELLNFEENLYQDGFEKEIKHMLDLIIEFLRRCGCNKL